MIDYLRGILLECETTHAVIETGGVGYGVSVSAATAAALGQPGSEVALWIRTYVREEALRLFGFATRQEREAFDLFISLPGVGPALGLAVLSTLGIAEIVQAASTGDASRFKRVKGIGPRMAEKLVLELKTKVDRLAAGLEPAQRLEIETPEPLRGEAARDAVAALEALEVRPTQARRAIALAMEALGEGATVEALVREGLKHRR